MKNQMPIGLKIIRILSIIIFFITILSLISGLGAVFTSVLASTVLIASIIFYGSIIHATGMQSKISFRIAVVILCGLIMIDILLLSVNIIDHIVGRVVVESILLAYLIKKKSYFSK